MSSRKIERVLVVGLDCAAPEFLFGTNRFKLPHIQSLIDAGCWGRLQSCCPPITVPAWSCMTSGKDPGTLGCYGFRNRRDRSYGPLRVSTSLDVHEPRVWDLLSAHSKDVVVLGVPQTYPPSPVHGCLVSGMLTPDTTADYTHPASLKNEIANACGAYQTDVADFRTDDKDGLLDRIYAFMRNRFDVAEYLMDRKPWDFFMMVEMGVDRLHHAFWHYADPAHPEYEAGNRYENVLREYYEAVDARIGRLLSRVGDETAVLVVSDHGAKALHGGIRINQWLIDEGLLVLRETPAGLSRIEDCAIDWPNTKVWSTGGYYARLFLNVAGREPEGAVPARDYEALRNDVCARLEAMPGAAGTPLGNRVFKPEEIYAKVNGVAPDLIAYLGNLHWRAIGSVGADSIYAPGNDTGPDEANHAEHGVFVMNDRSGCAGAEREGLNLIDVAPTVLKLLGVPVPADMQGKSIV